jgi:antirestriction protein ArdC
MTKKFKKHPVGMTISDLQEKISQQVIEMIKEDGLQWFQRWAPARTPLNGVTGHVYSGINILTTAMWMMANGTDDPRFLPRSVVFSKDEKTRVGRLRKGAKSIPIIAAGRYVKTDESTDDTTSRTYYKIYHVWHVSQIEDLDETKLVSPTIGDIPETPAERDAALESFVNNTGAVIEPAQAAFYAIKSDKIGMPDIQTFLNNDTTTAQEYYYSTLLHELIHWTGAKQRLDRPTLAHVGRKKEDQAREELVAEIGAVMAGMHLGLQVSPREDNASYIQGWVSLLEDKPAAIFEAASAAGRAVKFLMDKQENLNQETEIFEDENA